MHHLSPTPPTLHDITPDEFHRLVESTPGFPPKACITCYRPLPVTGKERTFRWYENGDPSLPIVEYVCDCDEQMKLYFALLASGIGVRYQRLGWDDAHSIDPAVQRQVIAYMGKAEAYVRRGIGMVLIGEVGTGKTLLSTLWLKGMIAKGYTGVFAQFKDIVDLYTKSWRQDSEKRIFQQRIINAQLLVIDDIGRENQGRIGVTGEMVDQVIRSRVNDQRPTVITSNLTLDEIAQLYSINAVSLLNGCSLDIVFGGADFRVSGKGRDMVEIDEDITRPVMLG